jgi:hypothetical protein
MTKVEELEPTPRELTDDDIATAKPRVRWLHLQRYEQLWDRVQERVHQDKDHDNGRPIDPRFLEIGIRILKEEAALYQMGRVLPPVEEDDDPSITGVDRQALVLAQLEDLEAKRQAQAEDLRRRTEGPAPVPTPDQESSNQDPGLDPSPQP